MYGSDRKHLRWNCPTSIENGKVVFKNEFGKDLFTIDPSIANRKMRRLISAKKRKNKK